MGLLISDMPWCKLACRDIIRYNADKGKGSPLAHTKVPSLPLTARCSPLLNYIYSWGKALAAKTPYGGREINKISIGPIDLPSERFIVREVGKPQGEARPHCCLTHFWGARDVPKSLTEAIRPANSPWWQTPDSVAPKQKKRRREVIWNRKEQVLASWT